MKKLYWKEPISKFLLDRIRLRPSFGLKGKLMVLEIIHYRSPYIILVMREKRTFCQMFLNKNLNHFRMRWGRIRTRKGYFGLCGRGVWQHCWAQYADENMPSSVCSAIILRTPWSRRLLGPRRRDFSVTYCGLQTWRGSQPSGRSRNKHPSNWLGEATNHVILSVLQFYEDGIRFVQNPSTF